MIKKKINVIEKHPFSDFSLLTKLLKAEDELNTKKEAVKKHSKKRKR